MVVVGRRVPRVFREKDRRDGRDSRDAAPSLVSLESFKSLRFTVKPCSGPRASFTYHSCTVASHGQVSRWPSAFTAGALVFPEAVALQLEPPLPPALDGLEGMTPRLIRRADARPVGLCEPLGHGQRIARCGAAAAVVDELRRLRLQDCDKKKAAT